jgi:hypothetical protein
MKSLAEKIEISMDSVAPLPQSLLEELAANLIAITEINLLETDEEAEHGL